MPEQTVDTDGHVGSETALAVDSKGKAHISYRNEDTTALHYATNAGASWITQVIDQSGAYTSIGVDSADKVHIGYYSNVTVQ